MSRMIRYRSERDNIESKEKQERIEIDKRESEPPYIQL